MGAGFSSSETLSTPDRIKTHLRVIISAPDTAVPIWSNIASTFSLIVRFAPKETRLEDERVLRKTAPMEHKSFKIDDQFHLPISQKAKRVDGTHRSKLCLPNALVAFMVLAIYFAISTYGPGHDSHASICSSKDLEVLSCSSRSNVTDSCCVENPGGLLLQTQLYNPRLGPADSWTIHGLWSDYCNGKLRYASFMK